MSPRLKRVAKVVIALIVVVGLALATRSAVGQWRQQRDAALGRVAEITLAIERANQRPSTRDQILSLQIQRDVATADVPELANLRWAKIALASLLYAIGLVPGGLVLYEATRVLGHRVKLSDAVSAQLVGHLGKYVPGKAMVVVIRAGRLAGVGVPILVGSIAVFLETLLMMAVGAAVAGCLIFLLPVPRWIAWAALMGGVGATLLTLPPIMKRVIAKISKTKDSNGETNSSGEQPSNQGLIRQDWRFFALAWGWQLVAWVLIGVSFALLVQSIPGGSHEFSRPMIVAASIASIALAMVVGFASLLPGGAGVRELTLAIVLAPVVGPSQALLAAILARLLFIVVELLAVSVVVLIGRFR